jgi:hypothetical protein
MRLAPHEEQQFDFLLLTAVERYTERLEQRCGGAGTALRRLREEPEGEGIWLTQFATAIFQDFLLDTVGGACFVLQALASQPIPEIAQGGDGKSKVKIEDVLNAMALTAFAAVLRAKTEESLERAALFEASSVGAGQ